MLCVALLAAVSCSKGDEGAELRLTGDVYGFYLGEAKADVFSRAGRSVRIARAPDPPLGYRGELYTLSATLDSSVGVDHVRCAFLDGRLLEIIVYFRDTSRANLARLKEELEAIYGRTFQAEDPSREMVQKTYRFSLPDMSVTLRRITKESGVNTKELYELFPAGPAKK